MDRYLLLRKRKELLGRNLSISFSKTPLFITRSERQYLIDDEGRHYVDCVNNVTHVGHCHPHIIKAAHKQMSVLNTNTRYIYPIITEYAEKLLAKFPKPLGVVFFCNSGSEANDLAIRLARTYTGRRDLMCVDHAYHGHTSSLIEISPYKYQGKGGFEQRGYVHKVPMPDGFRGPVRHSDPKIAEKYAGEVKKVIEQAEKKQQKIAAFFCESILGCGGQMVLPQGYMKKAFAHVRAAGGLCIADEVQVGFGRVGTHFWGFETQGVVPDIVTMGKPMGNGYPLAAVVTTAEIADRFNNGMEYFNTFGGSPLSCAVGNAVLEVIERENLQQNAKLVGDFLLQSFKALAPKYDFIGEVRGLGLFIGVELVKGPMDCPQPDAELTTYVVNRLRHWETTHIETGQKISGFLLSTDGPDHNVIKFKPPMVFGMAEAKMLVEALDIIMQQAQTSRMIRARL